MQRERAIATLLLLPTGKLTWIFLGLLGDLHAFQIMHGDFFGFFFGHVAHPDWSQGQVFHDRQMWEQIEVLEHHADFTTDFIDFS